MNYFIKFLFNLIRILATLGYLVVFAIFLLFFVLMLPIYWVQTWETITNSLFYSAILGSICTFICAWYILLTWQAGFKLIWALKVAPQKVREETPATEPEPIIVVPEEVSKFIQFDVNGVQGFRAIDYQS